ncbi:MAG: hypothetical protein F2738_05455 [Actinobacteria bacterium]|nr:hypothetical protein [Actinomycetota bacterium]
MKLNSLVVTTIASICGLLTLAQMGAERPVLAEPQPCVTYQIEGTIDSTDTTSLDTTSPEQKRQAEVYVHFGEKPLVRHQVFVTFAGVMDQILGEPVLLVTDELGRATVEVPLGAVNVAFMTESPGPENCSVSIGVEREPVIVAARIPVQPSVDGPVGLDQGVTYADIYDTAPFVNQTGNVDVPAPELAHTGPVSRVVLLVSTVIFAAGIGLGMGRGRQAARAER